jgi:hypothetical protein
MRSITVMLSTLMFIVLIISTYIYEKQDPVSLPQPIQRTDSLEQEPESLKPTTNETISYTLQKNELNITYNEGNDWMKVPIDTESLFQGEYQGNQTELIEDSYILTKDMVAFLYAEATSVLLKYSRDQGDTWQDSVITDSFAPMRFRKVDFLNGSFGYAILSGDRTMSQEYSTVFLTHDGGETWEKTTELPTTRLIAFGSFVDEQTGYLSYGTINPEEPDVYITQNGGDTWTQAQFNIPEKYALVFVQAEEPIKEENFLSVLVNQGPNGDYAGGKVKGKFISEDNGLTWKFHMEVEPDEAERE